MTALDALDRARAAWDATQPQLQLFAPLREPEMGEGPVAPARGGADGSPRLRRPLLPSPPRAAAQPSPQIRRRP